MNSDITYHGKVVVFDLDDTLFRERDFCRSGFHFLCDPNAYRAIDTDDYPSQDQLASLEKRMDEALSKRENPFSHFDSFFSPIALNKGSAWDLQRHIDAYRSHLPSRLNFAGGVEDTLIRLAAQGIKMALITDGRSKTQRNKIKALGLDRFLAPELILISEETGCDKHSKDMFATVVRYFPEARCFYYVGDNPEKDFYWPNLLGWTSIQAPYHPDNVHPASDPKSALHTPAFTLPSFTDLISHI